MSDRLAGSARAWVLGGAGLTLVLWLSSLGHGFSQADESWTVQVFDRVAAGDSLYEGVFFGVTPLSVWVGLPFAWIFGSQIIVLKALCAVVLAATALIAAWLAGRYGVGRLGQAGVVLACVLYGGGPTGPLYTPLATLCVLGCLAGVTVWRERAAASRPLADRPLILAGAAAGLAAASKQTLGAYAAIALLIAIWLAHPGADVDLRRRARDTALALAACGGAFAVAMAPIALSGDLAEFFRYAIDKGEYLGSGAISYLDTFDDFLDRLGAPTEDTRGLIISSAVLVPPLALMSVAAIARRSRPSAIVLGAFTLGAIAGIFPRADVSHVQSAAPICAVTIAAGVAASAGLLGTGVRRAAGAVALAGLALAAAWALAATPLRSLDNGHVVSSLPHLSGPLVDPASEDASLEIGAALRTADGGRDRLLVVSPAAGYLYLVAELESPTRFDYPLESAFRGDDQTVVARAIASGDLGPVCINDAAGTLFGELAPRDLIADVVSGLDRVATLEPPGAGLAGCTLYGPPLR